MLVSQTLALGMPCTTAADGNRFVVAWSARTNSSDYAVRAARIGEGTEPFDVETGTGASYDAPVAVACMDDGSFAVAWGDEDDKVWLMRYGADAAAPPLDPMSNRVSTDPTPVTGQTVTVAARGASMDDPDSRIVVVWESPGANAPVFRSYSGTGMPLEAAPIALACPDGGGPGGGRRLGTSVQHTAVIRPDGLLAVAWHSNSDDGGDGNHYCTVRAMGETVSIPTLSDWGSLTMALVVLTVGTVVFLRRVPSRSPG